ncbi:MAG: carbohydrate ABC transporter permease [Spirochaetia bacterium]|jgi:multiple sugar transport system permease protein|nr:carbohydrate ABC transporter permease [Spirochaetia bacterium]
MANVLKRQIRRSAKKTSLYIILVGIACIIIFPVFFLFSFSFMSDYETYSEWPKPLVPSFKAHFMIDKDVEGYHLFIFNKSEDDFMPFGPLVFTNNEKDVDNLRKFIKLQSNCKISSQQIVEYLEVVDSDSRVEFTIRKDLLANYILFFQVVNGAPKAVLNSLMVAGATILISLTIGGMGGYAFARYFFKGKNILKLSVLFVRMFPAVSLAIPMVIILAKMGLYDQPLGLSLVYSVGQISMSIWITASVFMSIPVSLEEAAMIFGTTKVGAFWHITLPLALPGLAACAMYSFIGSWNEVIAAVVLTQFNPTFPVIVYKALVGSQGQINLITAGSVAQAVPAIIFTLIIRKYIIQMWGGVKV